MNEPIHEGARWLVVLDREDIGAKQGAIVSQHRTRRAAVVAAGPDYFANPLKVMSVREYLIHYKGAE